MSNLLESYPAKIKRSDVIIDAIKTMIVQNSLKPGDRLPSEKDLIDQFNSSRGTIRETLKSLEILGLIERTPGPKGGTRVRAVHIQEAMQALANYLHFKDVSPVDIYHVRITLEPMMAESATGRIRAEQFDQLEERVALAEQYLEGKKSRMQCRRAELEFHDIIADACPNLFLSFVCTFINYLLGNFLHIDSLESRLDRKFAEENLAYHIKILDALKNEDPTKVREFMAGHMQSARDHIVRLGAFIDNSLISNRDI